MSANTPPRKSVPETHPERIDEALDQYVVLMTRRGTDPYTIRRRTLAHILGVSADACTGMLQAHRLAHASKRGTRYVLAARGYGTRAVWYIIGKPGDDPADVQTRRREHEIWVVEDALRRLLHDHLYETTPALRDGRFDPLIAQVARATAQVFSAQAEFVREVVSS